MTILGGTEVCLDDLISSCKLKSLLAGVLDKLNEQDGAIKQLRERDAVLGKFRKQVVAALQMCVERDQSRERLDEKLSALEDLTTRLSKIDASFAEAETRAQALAHQLTCVELQFEQRVASLEKKMDAQVEHRVATLESEMETQSALLEEHLAMHVGRSEAGKDELAMRTIQRIETRLESTDQTLQQLQAQADPHANKFSAYDGTSPEPEHEEELREQEREREREREREQEQQQKQQKVQEQDEDISIAAPKAPVASMEPTISVGLLFSGLDSQHAPLMRLVQDLPAVNTMLEKAKAILGWDVHDAFLSGRIDEPEFCQPAAFIIGLATMERLRQDQKEAAECFQATAGFGTGEYIALCVAGVFSFEDGLKLVDFRGQVTREAGKMCKQATLWVKGLEKPMLEELCKKARRKEGSGAVCQISGEIFPRGIACAGTELAIGHLKRMSWEAGAMQVEVLKAWDAFYTPLMAPAMEEVGKALDEMLPKMNPPRHTVYMTATAEPIKPGTNPKEVVELLKRQLISPVLWEPSVRAMIKCGVTEFYDVGPGWMMRHWMRHIDPKAFLRQPRVPRPFVDSQRP